MTTDTVTAPAKNGNAAQQQIDRASIKALIEKAKLDAYDHFREYDEWMNANAKDIQAADKLLKDLQQQRQQRQTDWSSKELEARAYVDGLKASLGKQG